MNCLFFYYYDDNKLLIIINQLGNLVKNKKKLDAGKSFKGSGNHKNDIEVSIIKYLICW